jgi:hypothetical protein
VCGWPSKDLLKGRLADKYPSSRYVFDGQQLFAAVTSSSLADRNCEKSSLALQSDIG